MSVKYQRLIRKNIERAARPLRPWPALVGDGAGTIEVPGYTALWYVRAVGSDLPIPVRRGGAPKIEGTHVWVGHNYDDLHDRRVVRIVGLGDGSPSMSEPGVGIHASTHAADGSDPVHISNSQMVDALVYATTGMNIKVNQGWVIIDGQPVKITPTTIDVSLYTGVYESGASYALVRVGNNGAVSIQEGMAVDNISVLTWDDVPKVAPHYAAIGIIRLYNGQESLSRTSTNPDVIPIALAQTNQSLTVRELDYGPNVDNVKEIVVSNGTLTNNGNGIVSLTTGAGAGDGTDLGWYNVADYGATGDGTTDDSGAFQDAVDACEAAGGGTIYIPATSNSYKLSSGITLDGAKRAAIYFDDGAHLHPAAGVTALLIHQGNVSGGNYVGHGREVVIYRPQIDGQSGAGTIGIEIRDSDRVAIHHPEIRDCDIGVYLHAVTSQCEGCEISGTGDIDGTGNDSDVKFVAEVASNKSFCQTYIKDLEFTSGTNGGIYIGANANLHRSWIEGVSWPAENQTIVYCDGNLTGTYIKISVDYMALNRTLIKVLDINSNSVGTNLAWLWFDFTGVLATMPWNNAFEASAGKTAYFYAEGPYKYILESTGVTAIPDHDPVTISDTATINLSLSGQEISADLIDTAVTPGSYKTSNITVDQQGRLTAVSNGALDDLSDVNTTGVVNGAALVYDTTAVGWRDSILMRDVGTDVRHGNASDYLDIDTDGTITMVGDSRVFREVRFDATVATKGADAPTAATRAVGASGNVKVPVIQFSKTTQQDVYFEIHAPSDMDGTENVYFHLMWFPGASWTTGNYMWKLEYLISDETGVALNVGAPTTISADVTPTAATNVIETDFATAITGFDVEHVLWCHFYRDVANDNGDDVGSVRWFELQYTMNKLGEKYSTPARYLIDDDSKYLIDDNSDNLTD